MPKQTRLDEDAVIYQPRKEQSEKEKIRDLPFRKKVSYLWEYYRLHAIIVIGVISLSAYIIYNIATPNIKSQFYAAMINSTIDPEILENYNNDFTEYLQLDLETENVVFNSMFYFNTPDNAMNMKQVLSTYVASQEVDVIIAPESELSTYALFGYLDKLSDQLPTDVYSSLTDNFYMTNLDNETQKNVYGIYLTDTTLYKNNADNSDPYILGIVANSKHKENAIEFIRFLFND